MFKLRGIKEFKRLMEYMKPRMCSYLIGLFGQSIGNASVYIILAFILQELILAAEKKDITLVFGIVKLMGIVLIVLIIFMPMCFYLYKKAVRTTMIEIKEEVFKKIEILPMEYFDENHSGNIILKVSNDILLAEKAYTNGLKEILTTGILGFGSAVIMMYMNWKIACTLLVIGAILLSINMKFAEPIRNLSIKIQEKNGIIMEFFEEQLAGFFVTKLFRKENLIKKQFLDANNNITESTKARVKKFSYLEGTNFILSMIGFGGSLVIGTIMVMNGEIEFAMLGAIVQFQINISEAFLDAGRRFSELQVSLVSSKRIFDLLDLESENSGTKILESKNNEGPIVEFKNVVYSYRNNQKVLDNVSFKINKGEVIAFVGPSGGGKSTLLKLLLGFYKVDLGEIMLFGENINEYELTTMRDAIAYVSQDSYLFTGTIKENILYGKENAKDEEVIKAAKAANIHEFIMTLPKNYETVIEESGKDMSGGQRQRISIARAFLKNSDIILLDEATSALDTKNEQKIKESLEVLMRGKTVIMVAHRLSTIEKANKIFVINEGKIIEQGTHNELIASNGLYKELIEKSNK